MTKFLLHKNIFFLLVLLQFFSPFNIFSQIVNLDNLSNKDNLDGIWENSERFVEIKSQNDEILSIDITLKPFYNFYYDGIYKTKYIPEANTFAKIGDGLYLEYWTKGSAFYTQKNIKPEPLDQIENKITGTYWRPSGNLKEISIDKPQILSKLTGYFILQTLTETYVYAVPYWIVNLDYKQDLATIKIKKDDESSISLLVDKYIRINNTVYTCATGQRTTIRNVQIFSNLPGIPIYSDDKTLMTLNSPYLIKSKIKNMSEEIAIHNSITYPPHSGKATFEEPSIYKKMENNEVPLNGGSYFKSNIEESDLEN